MSAYESEEEQVEAIRRWWRANGRSVIIGVVIAIAGVIGWNQWQSHERSQAISASQGYQAIVSALAADDSDKAAAILTELRDNHGGSVYATLASLRVAAARVDGGDPQAALEAVRWAVTNAGSEGLRQLARLREAQVLDALERPGEALTVLDPVPEGPFAARFHELIGDLRLASGKADAAIQAYRDAVASNPVNRRRSLIEMKLADLGAAPEPAS